MPTQMIDPPYIPRGMTLKELLDELTADEGLSDAMREECRKAAMKLAPRREPAVERKEV